MQGRDPTTHYKEVPSLPYVRCHPSFQGGRRISTSMKPPEYPFAGQIKGVVIIGLCARSSAGNCRLSLDISKHRFHRCGDFRLSQPEVQFSLLCVGAGIS